METIAVMFYIKFCNNSWLFVLYTQHNKDAMTQFFIKIHLSLYWKGYVWEGVGDRTELQHIDLPSSAGHSSVSFSFSRVAQLEARGPSLSGCWFSLPHLISNSSGPQNSLNFLCTELYNSSTSTRSRYLPITGHRNMHFRRLWNGMFDRHRAEITVMQFTGHSLPVHQFVTVPWDFNPVPYCQPSSPTPMEYALPPSLEWHVWPGRRSIYYIRQGQKISTVSVHTEHRLTAYSIDAMWG